MKDKQSRLGKNDSQECLTPISPPRPCHVTPTRCKHASPILHQAPPIRLCFAEGRHPEEAPEEATELSNEEARQTGHVRWEVYAAYMSATGIGLSTVILASLVLMQVGPAFLLQCEAHARFSVSISFPSP